MLKIDNVRKKIEQLHESEAKSLLLMMYARLDTAINGTGGDEVIKQTVKDLYDIYSRLPERENGKNG